jgi:anti-anti-sigma factor
MFTEPNFWYKPLFEEIENDGKRLTKTYTDSFIKDIEIYNHNNIAVIQINLGRATLIISKKFKDLVDELIDTGVNQIVVDLTACNLIDSTFWGTLIYAQKKIHKFDGSIRLVSSFEKHSALTITTRMDKIFKIYDNIKQAIHSFDNTNLNSTLADFD